MDKQQARDCVEETFRQEFEEGRFLYFIRNLANHFDIKGINVI